MRLAHMHLMVEDVQRSVDFYVSLGFRFTGTQLIEKGRFITDHWMEPGTEIAFVRDPDGGEIALEKTKKVEPLPAWFHWGFLLASADAVASLYARLKARGVPLRKLTRENDAICFRAYDPDGYLLEFCYEPGRKLESQEVSAHG